MESGRSFATFCDALPVRPSAADTAGRLPRCGVYGRIFIRRAQRLIQSAVENLTRYDDLIDDEKNFDEKLLERLSIDMTPAQIEEAAQIFESDMQGVARHAASAMKAIQSPATAMQRHCASDRDVTELRSALINNLV